MANRVNYRDGLLVSMMVDHGDGTGTLTTYDEDGNVTGTEAVSDLPAASADLPAPPDPLVVLASVGEALAAITPSSTTTTIRAALLAARTAIDNAIGG